MNYDFDTLISRKSSSSLKWDKYQNTDIIPFWVADMDFAIAPEIHSALQQRLNHPIFGYTRAPDELTDVLIAHLKSIYQWEIHADWLVWLPGVVPGLSAACRAFLSAGDHVMTHPPIYHHFFSVHDKRQNQLLTVPLHKVDDRWTYDLPAIEAAITPETKLFMLCSPHNPTGTVFTADELHALCMLAKEHDIVVVSDEIHCGLVLNENTPHTVSAKACSEYAEGIVTLMSQSKTFNLAGMNCSFAIISNPNLRQRYTDACVEVLPMLHPFAYESALAAFRDGEPWRQALLSYLRGNYEYLRTELSQIPGLTLQRCDATYLAWIDATQLGAKSSAAYFEKHGVGLSDGEQFGQPGYLRLNFACPRKQLSEGVSRIRHAVNA